MVLDKLSESLKGTLSKIAKAMFVDEKLIDELVKDIQRALLSFNFNINVSETYHFKYQRINEKLWLKLIQKR